MHILDLDDDILSHISLMFGASPQNYFQRRLAGCVCTRLSMLFKHLFGCDQRICIDGELVNKIAKGSVIPSYDMDECVWVSIDDLKDKYLCRLWGYNGHVRLYKNPFTWKFSFYDSDMKVWLNTSSSQKVSDRLIRNKSVHVPAIPDDISRSVHIVQFKRKRSEVEQQSNEFLTLTLKLKWSKLMSNVCRDISLPMNHNLIAVSCKNTLSTKKEFDMLAEALPSSRIRKLNISSHNVELREEDALSNVLLKATSLEHLNISYCDYFSIHETACLLHLLSTTKVLDKLKIVSTTTSFPGILEEETSIYKFQGFLSHDQFPIYASNLCDSLRHLKMELYANISDYEYDRLRLKNLDVLILFSDQHYDSMMCIYQSNLIEEMEHDRQIDHVMQKFMEIELPELYVKKCKQKSASNAFKSMKNERYVRRNLHRNQLLPYARACKYCGCVWAQGSIKIQTFEGIQSMCKLGKRNCEESIHYKKRGDA